MNLDDFAINSYAGSVTRPSRLDAATVDLCLSSVPQLGGNFDFPVFVLSFTLPAY